MLTGQKSSKLTKSLHYFASIGKIQNPRRGIYTKDGYDVEEMACSLFRPSYISMEYVLGQLRQLEPSSIAICTFLFKPGKFKRNYKIDYIGKEIPDDFIVGYGLDYEGVGRTYRDIYVYEGL